MSRPAGRRWPMGIGRPRPHRTLTTVVIWTILILSTLCVTADAVEERTPPLRRLRHGRHMEVDEFVEVEEILFDRSAAPEIPAYLQRRQDLFESPSASSTTSHPVEKGSTSLQRPTFDPTATPLTSVALSLATRDSSTASTATSSGTESTTSSSPPVPESPLPVPFDSGFGTNYTQQSCPAFLRSVASNETFTSCVPFSILLQVSMRDRPLNQPWANGLEFRFLFPRLERRHQHRSNPGRILQRRLSVM